MGGKGVRNAPVFHKKLPTGPNSAVRQPFFGILAKMSSSGFFRGSAVVRRGSAVGFRGVSHGLWGFKLPGSQAASQSPCQAARQPGKQPARQPGSQAACMHACLPASQPSKQPGIQAARQASSSQAAREPGSQASSQPASQASSQAARHPGSQASRPSSQSARQPIIPVIQPVRQRCDPVSQNVVIQSARPIRCVMSQSVSGSYHQSVSGSCMVRCVGQAVGLGQSVACFVQSGVWSCPVRCMVSQLGC